MSERVLVAGDDTSLRESLCRHLHLEGYTCDEAADEQRALHLLNVTADRIYDLVIADLDAFAIDGLLACELGKRVSSRTSILVTTGPRGTLDAFAALERYADDYLAKPFSMRELVARSRALIRRSHLRQKEATAPIAARAVQLAVSRQREYLADASSVDLTRNPAGLERALAIIAEDKEVLEVANRATQHLYFTNPIKKFEERSSNLWSTHPPIVDRINRLRQLTGEGPLDATETHELAGLD